MQIYKNTVVNACIQEQFFINLFGEKPQRGKPWDFPVVALHNHSNFII